MVGNRTHDLQISNPTANHSAMLALKLLKLMKNLQQKACTCAADVRVPIPGRVGSVNARLHPQPGFNDAARLSAARSASGARGEICACGLRKSRGYPCWFDRPIRKFD
ncbi:hypothetical protein ElyMa_005769700 [Elysia marginata]|uniref:Uncharacterized protein n=1 Tax=Elysia marginata TaxID=1093978 RepID=A0AAV4FP93_9GAST|nr:hypothetical protein ElyMa_005769700 [Elysia marginata]